METIDIIQQLNFEISRLQQAKAILTGTVTKRSPDRPKGTQPVLKPVAVEPTKRVMSAEGKARIATAQKLRWAKLKRADRKTAKKAAAKSVPAKKALGKKLLPPSHPRSKRKQRKTGPFTKTKVL
jgi:hypothetical protein